MNERRQVELLHKLFYFETPITSVLPKQNKTFTHNSTKKKVHRLLADFFFFTFVGLQETWPGAIVPDEEVRKRF